MDRLALLLWIPVSAILFLRHRVAVAATLVYLGAVMFLPELTSFDLPGLPALNKETVAMLCILIATVRYVRGARGSWGDHPLVETLLVLLVPLCGFGTALTNQRAVVYGPHRDPPLSLYDGLGLTINDLVIYATPFLLGRTLFRTRRDLILLVEALVIAGLVYSALTLLEARVSPHLHKWIYGYHPGYFRYSYRLGGYRPMVFMRSGLALGAFMAGVTIAAAALSKAQRQIGFLSTKAAAYYLGVVFVLCRSLGSMLHGFSMILLLSCFKTRSVAKVLMLLCLLILGYPLIRQAGLFPRHTIVGVASSINEERSRSLEYRFANEELLTKKGNEKILFGWGGYGRNRVYDWRGRLLTIPDSAWVIFLTQRGVFGLVYVFGLLLFPVWYACKLALHTPDLQLRILLLGLSAVLVSRGIDLMVNGWYTSIPLFLSGGLLGISRNLLSIERRSSKAPADAPDPS